MPILYLQKVARLCTRFGSKDEASRMSNQIQLLTQATQDKPDRNSSCRTTKEIFWQEMLFHTCAPYEKAQALKCKIS